MASDAPLMVLTGGPGCGKTTAVQTIVKLWCAQRKMVRIAAPTGERSWAGRGLGGWVGWGRGPCGQQGCGAAEGSTWHSCGTGEAADRATWPACSMRDPRAGPPTPPASLSAALILSHHAAPFHPMQAGRRSAWAQFRASSPAPCTACWPTSRGAAAAAEAWQRAASTLRRMSPQRRGRRVASNTIGEPDPSKD